VRQSGLSLKELGERTGVDHGRLSRFLRGQRTLTLPAAARVCAVLGLQLCSAGAAALTTNGPTTAAAPSARPTGAAEAAPKRFRGRLRKVRRE
jgi:transcriptional regulator with XRE-family HTH domain